MHVLTSSVEPHNLNCVGIPKYHVKTINTYTLSPIKNKVRKIKSDETVKKKRWILTLIKKYNWISFLNVIFMFKLIIFHQSS
jgi:hypothetical protein